LKKLDTYLVREMIVPFLIGTVAVVLMFQINTYMALAKTLNLDNVPFKAVLQFIMYKTPEYMKMTLPVGTSLAAALAMTRIARESELTAMRAAGTRITRVVAPIAAFGLAVAFFNFYIVEKVIPPTSRRANNIARQAGILGYSKQTFKTNAIIELGKFTASFGSVDRTPDDKLVINDVLLFERPEPGVVTITSAKQALYDLGVWSFKQAYLWQVQGEDLVIAKPKGDFVINEKIVVDSMFENASPQESTIPELKTEIASRRKLGQDAKKLEIDLQTRYSVPVACMIFAIVSPVFAVLFSRSGGFVGVLVSFVVVLLYYNAFVVSTEILGKMDVVPVWLAAWSPNIIFGVLGLLALRRLE
jgi:lipopolysaccharide export system permease protein